MGPVGVCMCVALLPLGVYTPSGGFGIYCCLSNFLRAEVSRKYSLREENFSTNPLINCLIYGVCYPCSFFQMYSTIKHYESKNKYHIQKEDVSGQFRRKSPIFLWWFFCSLSFFCNDNHLFMHRIRLILHYPNSIVLHAYTYSASIDGKKMNEKQS